LANVHHNNNVVGRADVKVNYYHAQYLYNSMKSKTLLYILIALAIVAIAAFIIYQFVYRGNGNVLSGLLGQTGSLPSSTVQNFQQTSTTAAFGANGKSTSSSSKFGVVSNDPALDYFVDSANIVTLVKTDGTIESIANNKTSVLSTSTLTNIISVVFSYDGKKILISTRTGTTTQTYLFSLGAQALTRLPDGMQSPVWSPINYQIAYLAPTNSGSEKLMTIDAGTANIKPVTVTSLAMEDMLLQWPSKNTIVISDRPSAFTTGSIWLFNIPSQTLSVVSYEALGVESLWNTSGSALVFSAKSSNAGGQLALRDTTGGQKTFSFVTLPSKCTFGPSAATPSTTSTVNPSSMIYCAAPVDQDTFSIVRLPDEYDQKIYFSDDAFYSIDSTTGSLNEIFSFSEADRDLDATHMKVFNNILFFINCYDQKVYALAL
jgi:hypothetical protein